MSDKYFPDLVGQRAVKKKLAFYIEAFNKTRQCPFLFFAGRAGIGKTEFAKAFAKNLYTEDGAKRPFLELNCSTIKNNEQFFEQIFLPLIADNEIVVLFDEAHELPSDLEQAFLTVFNSEKKSRKIISWNEMNFEFDFKRQTFIFATTESDKLFPPLKDRLTVIDFEPYSDIELGKILELCAPETFFPPDCLKAIVGTLRGNARSAVKRAKEIALYCGAKDKFDFNLDDFKALQDAVGILPLGITYTEKQILEKLHNHGALTLTTLCAKLGMSKTSIQRDHELYLLSKNLMEIDGKRKITSKGREVCEAF